eukprot:Skav225514  [mRNA]  locus=scaffold1721:420645:425789:- [translate_table: standard]
MNARKDGSLFNNMFYMKVIELSASLGSELPYIVGLQTELPFGKRDLAQLAKNTKVLDSNMNKVTTALAQLFFVATSMTRDDVGVDLNDGPWVARAPSRWRSSWRGDASIVPQGFTGKTL